MSYCLITIAADNFIDPFYTNTRDRLRFAVSGTGNLADAFDRLLPIEYRIEIHNEQLTRANLEETFIGLAPAKEREPSRLILLVSGHGDRSAQEHWFCTHDARPGLASLKGGDLADIIALARPSFVVVVMDFCYAGAVAQDMEVGLARALGDEAYLLLAGTGPGQLAYEHPSLGLGLFTFALQEALAEGALFSTTRQPGSPPAERSCELAKSFVFAQQRSDQLAYVYGGGTRQVPELFGKGQVPLIWTEEVTGPPMTHLPRKALANRLRRIVSWTFALTLLVSAFLYFKQYHLAVSADGWLEIRPGPSWMASITPQPRSLVEQLPIAVGDLDKPTSEWNEEQLERRANLVEGRIDGLRHGTNWVDAIDGDLSEEARRRVHFVLPGARIAAACETGGRQRDPARLYRWALEAALLDRSRSCPAAFFLENAPDVSDLYALKDPRSQMDFTILNLPDQGMRMYLAGLLLAYRESRDLEARKGVLEKAVLLIAARMEDDLPSNPDWSAFMVFLEGIAASPTEGLTALPRLSNCSETWCALPARLAISLASSGTTKDSEPALDLMTWLLARHSDKLSSQGGLADSWALPPLLLLARQGHLGAAEFDLLIRYFHWLQPHPGNNWIETEWLPRFARLLPLPENWGGFLWACAFSDATNSLSCSDFEADSAADILGAQGAYLDDSERQRLVARLAALLSSTDRVPLFGRTIADLACHSELPGNWLAALRQALSYNIRIAPPRDTDPLTGVMIIQVTDAIAARAYAAALLNSGYEEELAILLARYLGNHWGYRDLDIVRRALVDFSEEGAEAHDHARLRAMLRRLNGDARARISFFRAIDHAEDPMEGLLNHPVFGENVLWRLDAAIAVRRAIASFEYDPDRLC